MFERFCAFSINSHLPLNTPALPSIFTDGKLPRFAAVLRSPLLRNRKVKLDGHILIKGTDSESAYVKVEGSREMLYLQMPVTEATCEIPDAFKIQFQHYFEDVLGAQASIHKALAYCLILEGRPFFKCRVETAKEVVLKESDERQKLIKAY